MTTHKTFLTGEKTTLRLNIGPEGRVSKKAKRWLEVEYIIHLVANGNGGFSLASTGENFVLCEAAISYNGNYFVIDSGLQRDKSVRQFFEKYGEKRYYEVQCF